MPIEVFVHGALCVAYSGQCLTSESLGGRSANRGVCAQACRLPYELISDGARVNLGDRHYLLSPQDLAGIAMLPDLLNAGVASLKIEGRLKSPEYVANITRIYRNAIDQICHAMDAESPGPDEPARTWQVDHASQYEMEMAFSRGLYTGWLKGVNNQELVHGRFGKKRGVYLGEVTRVSVPRIMIKLQGPLKPGDGVVFDGGRPDLIEEGGRVYTIDWKPGKCGPDEAGLSFGQGRIQFHRIRPGDKVWKTDDPELNRELQSTYAGDTPRFRRSVNIRVEGRAAEPLKVTMRDEWGRDVKAQSAMMLSVAERQPLTDALLREQLGRLGGTSYRLGMLENRIDGQVLVPVSELNRIRRTLVELMDHEWGRLPPWSLQPGRRILEPAANPVSVQSPAEPELLILVRTFEQLEAVLDPGVRTVYCEFEDPKKYREAVALFRARQGVVAAEYSREGSPWPAIFVAPPRIHKVGEEWILNQVRSCGADGYLVRNYDHLTYFAGERRIGDYSLNVANPLSAEYFIARWGLERVTASSDLNHAELTALLGAAPLNWFEIILHQHMPMFHMEHCVFCAFLSQGTDYTNCGRPCDRHQLRLRDRVGAEHPVKADAGCRNTVYNARAQTGAEHVRRFIECGARRFRVEFLDETAEQVRRTVRMYEELLAGKREGVALWRELKLIHHLGVTRGPMG